MFAALIFSGTSIVHAIWISAVLKPALGSTVTVTTRTAMLSGMAATD